MPVSYRVPFIVVDSFDEKTLVVRTDYIIALIWSTGLLGGDHTEHLVAPRWRSSDPLDHV
jgi:hypothetical protein